MSIWSTWLLLDDDDMGGEGGMPYVYVASHLFPRPDGAREGFLEIAVIPGYVDDAIEHPWLRIGLGDGDEKDVTRVLNRDQVERLRDTLSNWLLLCRMR